ncbi:dolichol kinase [Stylonychia lemnae]|uniref:dolichol kinase n=1 Tax=Stylonychia lemnae TaxID=5949 RepID=A0A078ARG8_STYLE|nr:dolichol kinase [Stylonychia lemnae]|eukprot:CDW83443.1 dolichol kinase [Stylonychia lemnae]
MNEHIQKRRQQQARLREREEENKVDPKNEIGFFHLKGQYQISFRQPLYQGLVEAIFPILLQYLLSGYTNQWYYFQNLLFIYISYILKYFKCEYSAMKLPIRSIQTFYIGVTYFFYRNQVQLYHNLLMMFGIETFIEYIPGGLTFGELFNLSSLNSYYCCYFIETLKKQHISMYFVGKNTHNTLVFTPWAVFNLTWIIATLGSYVIKNKVINAFQSFVIAVAIVLGLIQQAQGLGHLMPFLEEIFFKCALPITVQFIVLGGGFQNKEFQLFGISGLIYLGIGDVFASVFGKKYGLVKWKNNNSKTTQGTQYFVFSTFIAYLMVINIIYPRYLDIFMVILLSTILGGICEGLTHQYDNLVCTIFFYYVLVTANNFFQGLI